MGFFASSDGLSFDLDELRILQENTSKTCEDLAKQHQNLKTGIEKLRQDWRTPAGDYFFKNLDTEWEQQIIKFETTINKFDEVLKYAIQEFEAVSQEAEQISFL